MRQEDELAQEVGGVELAGRTTAQPIAAQRDEAVDVRDAGRSDPVLHEPVRAPWIGWRPFDLQAGSAELARG